MVYIYYLFIVLALMWEISAFKDTKKIKTYIANYKGKKWESYSSSMKGLGCLMILYFIWIMFGLFTSQWLIFLIILGLSLIPKKNVYVKKLDAFITIILLLFAFLNQFHLHIDLLKGF